MGYIRSAARVLEGAANMTEGTLSAFFGGSLKNMGGGLLRAGKGAVEGAAGVAGLGFSAARTATNTLRGPIGRGLAVTGVGGILAGGLVGIGAIATAGSMGGYSMANARYNMDNARRSDMPMGVSNLAGSPAMNFRQFGGRQWRDPNADGQLAIALSNMRKG